MFYYMRSVSQQIPFCRIKHVDLRDFYRCAMPTKLFADPLEKLAKGRLGMTNTSARRSTLLIDLPVDLWEYSAWEYSAWEYSAWEYSAWKIENPICNIISFQLETAGAISMGPRTTTFVSVGVVVQKTSERVEALLGRRLVDYEGIDKEAV